MDLNYLGDGILLHWLVHDISENNVAGGVTYADRDGILPPEGTGLHRYVYLIFRQMKPIELITPEIGSRFEKTTEFVLIQQTILLQLD